VFLGPLEDFLSPFGPLDLDLDFGLDVCSDDDSLDEELCCVDDEGLEDRLTAGTGEVV
jgi:hypothetical protein